MTKNRPKNYLKLIILLFGISLILVNCHKDDPNKNLENSDEIQDIISRKLPFEQLPNFNKASKTLNKLKSDLNSPNSTFNKGSGENEMTVFTDEVLYMEYAETHTYTFKLLRSNPEFYVENIVLHYNVDTENYDEYLLQYDVSFDEYQDLLNGLPLWENTKVKISKLNAGTLSSLFGKSTCFRSCRTITANCTAGGNHPPDDPDCCATKGTCSSDQGGYTYQSCGTVCIDTTPTEEEDPEPSGSGGGGGGDSTSNDDVVTNPEPIPCEDRNSETDIDGNCFEDENSILEPNPCENINSLLTNTDIKNKIQSLKTTENLNLNYEKGFILKTDNTGSLTATPKNGNPNQNSMQVELSSNGEEPDGSVSGFIHTHYNGLLPAFSIGDIKTLNGAYQWRKYKNKPLKDLTVIVVTQSGVFALVIKDESAFETEGRKLHTSEFEDIKNEAEKDIAKKTKSNYQRSIRNLIDVILPTYGLDLYKANEDLTSWNKVNPDPNNKDNTITTPCN